MSNLLDCSPEPQLVVRNEPETGILHRDRAFCARVGGASTVLEACLLARVSRCVCTRPRGTGGSRRCWSIALTGVVDQEVVYALPELVEKFERRWLGETKLFPNNRLTNLAKRLELIEPRKASKRRSLFRSRQGGCASREYLAVPLLMRGLRGFRPRAWQAGTFEPARFVGIVRSSKFFPTFTQ